MYEKTCVQLLVCDGQKLVSGLSSLMAIEQDLGLRLAALFGNMPPALTGRTIHLKFGTLIVTGNYMHIYVSTELVLGELMPVKGKKRKKQEGVF
jgi:hypothetical protein